MPQICDITKDDMYEGKRPGKDCDELSLTMIVSPACDDSRKHSSLTRIKTGDFDGECRQTGRYNLNDEVAMEVV